MPRDTMSTMCRLSQREGRQASHWPGCQGERSGLERKKRLLQLIPASPTKALWPEMATTRTMSAADGRSHRQMLVPCAPVLPIFPTQRQPGPSWTFFVHTRGQLGSNSTQGCYGLSGREDYTICVVKGEQAFPRHPNWLLTRTPSNTLSFMPCFEYGRTHNSGLSLELLHTHLQQDTVQVTRDGKQTSFLTGTLFAAHDTDRVTFAYPPRHRHPSSPVSPFGGITGLSNQHDTTPRASYH